MLIVIPSHRRCPFAVVSGCHYFLFVYNETSPTVASYPRSWKRDDPSWDEQVLFPMNFSRAKIILVLIAILQRIIHLLEFS